MAESQKHGFQFEEIIRRKKLNDINNLLEKEVGYTNEWDVPPMQIKSFKFNSKTIEFGSIVRMFNKNENFILVLVGYEQEENVKKVVFSDCLLITKENLNKLRGGLNLNTIIELDEKIKTFKQGNHENARIWAKEMKKIHNSHTNFDIRFKIDSKNQRRIQCALKLNDLYENIEKELILKNQLNIKDIESETRKRN